MKTTLKNVSLILALGIVLLLGACSSGPGKSLYDQGLELVALMDEMAGSDAYAELYSSSPELREILSTAGDGDHTTPKAVYQITVSEDSLLALLEITDVDSLSDTLKNYTMTRALSGISNQINAAGGAQMLAAASICTVSKSFVSDELTGSSTLYLYTYEDAVPAIITFAAEEDGAISASGSFLFYEDISTDTQQDIEQLLSGLSLEAKVIRL